MYKLIKIKPVMLGSACALLLINPVMAAESGLSFSIRAQGGGWSGKNKTSDTEFESTEGSRLGFGVAYQNGDFYTGLNLQGGEYSFEKNTPDQVGPSGTTAVSNDKIQHSELDLIFGYFLTKNFSVFLDIKGVADTWTSNNHKQEYGGGGLGASGVWPINQDWTVYGSLGVISAGEIKTNGQKVGEGKSSAVDIGAMYAFSENHRLNFGLKRTNHVYKFDSGDEQTHSMGGVYVGYSYAFRL